VLNDAQKAVVDRAITESLVNVGYYLAGSPEENEVRMRRHVAIRFASHTLEEKELKYITLCERVRHSLDTLNIIRQKETS
jgi:hypothetical protein